jgi:cytochrome d ubiquinol oxidase subunit I
MEALWTTQKGAPLVLFAIPDERARRNHFSIEIPKGLSLVLRHDSAAEVKGLDDFEPNVPPVAPVFYSFRLMVGMGVLMIALSWLGAWMMRKGAQPPRWLLWAYAGFTFSGWIATLAGWMVTEIGRQPWLVTGIQLTSEAVGPANGVQLGASLTGYLATYALLLIAYMVVLTHLAGKGGGPEPGPSAGMAMKAAA